MRPAETVAEMAPGTSPTSTEKLAETAEALRKRVSGLEKESRAGEAQEEEARAGVIEIARVLEEAEDG